MEKNICLSCRFAFRNGKCNRLVVSSMGMTALAVTIRKTINALIMRKETIAETEIMSLLIFIIHNN